MGSWRALRESREVLQVTSTDVAGLARPASKGTARARLRGSTGAQDSPAEEPHPGEHKAPYPWRVGVSGSLTMGTDRPSVLLMETGVFSGTEMDTRQPKSNTCLLNTINSLATL